MLAERLLTSKIMNASQEGSLHGWLVFINLWDNQTVVCQRGQQQTENIKFEAKPWLDPIETKPQLSPPRHVYNIRFYESGKSTQFPTIFSSSHLQLIMKHCSQEHWEVTDNKTLAPILDCVVCGESYVLKGADVSNLEFSWLRGGWLN